MTIKHLYDIPQEFAMLESLLLETEGELSPELEQRFDEFLRGGKDKLEAGACVVRTLELDAEACKAEARRLSERAQSLGDNSDKLKKLMLAALDSAFDGKIKTSLFTIWGQTSAATKSFDVEPETDLSTLPEKFIRVKRELAKDALKEAAKLGETLPEEIIVTEFPGTRFLRIK